MTDLVTLPKVELHCHLLGVINPLILRRIRRDGCTALIEPETLEMAYPVSDLEAFRRWIHMLRPYQAATSEIMRPILAAHVSNLIQQHVVYAEIMLSPTMFPRDLPGLLAAFHRWREWAFEMEECRIQIEFIAVVPRTIDPVELEHDTAVFIELHREGLIVGVALVGVETGESIQKLAPSFLRWREAGLGIEIHAGEHCGPESIWDALEHGRPARLGHGLSAFEDSALLHHIRRHNIHIEFCLTSNLCTRAVKNIEQHPIGQARKLGLKFSLNTDDPGAFKCSLQGEYQIAADAFAFDSAEFMTIFHDSLAARFRAKLRYPSPPIQNAQSPTASIRGHQPSLTPGWPEQASKSGSDPPYGLY